MMSALTGSEPLRNCWQALEEIVPPGETPKKILISFWRLPLLDEKVNLLFICMAPICTFERANCNSCLILVSSAFFETSSASSFFLASLHFVASSLRSFFSFLNFFASFSRLSFFLLNIPSSWPKNRFWDDLAFGGHRLCRDRGGGCMRQPKIFGDDGRGDLLEWCTLGVVDPPPNTLVAPEVGTLEEATDWGEDERLGEFL